MALATDAVWVTAKDARSVLRIDPDTNAVVAEIPTDAEPQDLVVDDSGVWVTHDYVGGSVQLIDPGTNEVRTTMENLGSGGVTAGGGYIWVTSTSIGITRIDPQTYETSVVLELNERNYDLAYEEDELWVTSTSGWVYRLPLPMP